MKKFFTLFLSACIFAGICTGCASNTSSWSKEDFSFYTENKKEIAFPTDDTEPSLKKINEEQNGNFQTYRGVQIGDRASDAFAKYDMNNFYYSVTNKWGNSSVSDEYADKTDLEFHEKYPNFGRRLAASGRTFSKCRRVYRHGLLCRRQWTTYES